MKEIVALISHYKDNSFYRDYTTTFVNEGYLLFRTLFNRYKDLKIYFYYSTEQPNKLVQNLLEKKTYDTFCLGQNTFLVPLQQKSFNTPENIKKRN